VHEQNIQKLELCPTLAGFSFDDIDMKVRARTST
jgi:hypothetical protein